MKDHRHYRYHHLSSVIGFIGLFGFLTGNTWLSPFGWFFAFAIAFSDRYDERVEGNVNRACRNVFIFVMVGLTAIMATSFYLVALPPDPKAFAFVSLEIMFLYALALLSFLLSYFYYHKRGD